MRSTTDAHAVFCHCSYIVAKLQDKNFFQDPSTTEQKVRVFASVWHYEYLVDWHSSGTGCTITWTSLHP